MRYTNENYLVEKFEQDKKLVDAVEKYSFNNFLNYNPADNFIKKKILREVLGYHGLRIAFEIPDADFLPLDKCKPERINEVLKSSYFAALKRINKFGNPAKKQKKSLELKAESDGQFVLF